MQQFLSCFFTSLLVLLYWQGLQPELDVSKKISLAQPLKFSFCNTRTSGAGICVALVTPESWQINWVHPRWMLSLFATRFAACWGPTLIYRYFCVMWNYLQHRNIFRMNGTRPLIKSINIIFHLQSVYNMVNQLTEAEWHIYASVN